MDYMLMPITLQRSFKALTHLFLLLLLLKYVIWRLALYFISTSSGMEVRKAFFFFFVCLFIFYVLSIHQTEFTYEIIPDFLVYFIVSVDLIIIK